MKNLLKPLLQPIYFCHLRPKILSSLPTSTFSLQGCCFVFIPSTLSYCFPYHSAIRGSAGWHLLPGPRENEVGTLTCAFSTTGMHDILLISYHSVLFSPRFQA